jgi:hypothetical protein
MSKIKKILNAICILLLITIILPTESQAWLFYHKPAFKGKVIDAETKLPIKGAVVMVVYNKKLVAGFEPMTYLFDIRETLTDDKGFFGIPSYTTVINPLSVNAAVDFIIFKPGYGVYPGKQILPRGMNSNDQELFFSEYFGKERKIELLTGSTLKGTEPHTGWFNVIFGIVELPKLKTFEDRRINVLIDLPSDNNLLDKQRNLIRLINEERQNLGMQKAYEGR